MMNWVSAKLPAKNVEEILERLEPLANICPFLPGGKAEQRPLLMVDYWWCNADQIDFRAFKAGPIERIVFERTVESFPSAVHELIGEQREVRVLEWECKEFEVSLSVFSGFVKLFVITNSPDFLWILKRLNFFPSYQPGSFSYTDPYLGSKDFSTDWVPLNARLQRVSNSGTGAKWKIGEISISASFWDQDLQVPESLSFLLPIDSISKVLELVSQIAKECGSEIGRVKVLDRPYGSTPHASLAEGTWDIFFEGNYKPEINLLDRPSNLTRTVRYPLIQREEYLKKRAGEIELHWQFDIVHAPAESYLEVLSSRGIEFLLDFLKQNNLQGEILEDRFRGRL